MLKFISLVVPLLLVGCAGSWHPSIDTKVGFVVGGTTRMTGGAALMPRVAVEWTPAIPAVIGGYAVSVLRIPQTAMFALADACLKDMLPPKADCLAGDGCGEDYTPGDQSGEDSGVEVPTLPGGDGAGAGDYP